MKFVLAWSLSAHLAFCAGSNTLKWGNIHVSVPRKDPRSLSLVDSSVVVVDPDSVGIILEIAEAMGAGN
jgi:hypothetical protein